MIDIHVISLANASERREHAQAQFDRFNLPFHFFDALEGEEGLALFSHCDKQQFVLHTGRLPTPGEIGCFASHKALWQRCVDVQRPLLIMEDDFELAPYFPAAVQTAAELIAATGLLRLQDECRGMSVPVTRVGQFTLERYTKTPHCTMCYAITPDVAARMLALQEALYAPVDVVMKQVWTFNNPVYCLTPYAVTGSSLSFDSIIGERSKCSKRIGTRLRRFLLKTGWQCQRLAFNLRQSDARLRARCRQLRRPGTPARAADSGVDSMPGGATTD